MTNHDLANQIEFADNPEPRCPCVLLLDTSGSMRTERRIDLLNRGIRTFIDALRANALASLRVECAVVSFSDSAKIEADFCTADEFEPPTLKARGETQMAAGIRQALSMVDERKARYREAGVGYYQPWIIMLTDGEPHGGFRQLLTDQAERIADLEEDRRLAFWAVGVGEANMEKLGQIAVREPVRLRGLDFDGMFLWLSESLQAVSNSTAEVATPVLPEIGNWAEHYNAPQVSREIPEVRFEG
tara:strand:+ start:1087 stop:1818 length:732 start_codon:yes stop_codon:yes gene_type:complete